MEQAYKYMVVTRCLTFNHASYIVDAMNGFTMQETTFPVITLIVDDASTDSEPEVIRKYLSEHFQAPYRVEETDDFYLVCANHNTNPNCIFIVFFLKYNHYSIKKSKMPYLSEWQDNAKYIAICEGDDYWICSQKLQIQVDFMENNPNYSCCCHNFKRYYEQEMQFKEGFRYNDNFSFDTKGYLKYWPTQPLTALIKADCMPKLEDIKKYRYFRDNHLFYLLLRKGMGYYMAESMGVYRITQKGIWTSLDEIQRTYIDFKCYLELFHNNLFDILLFKQCLSLYSYYVYLSCLNGQSYKKLSIKDLGILGMIITKVRIFYLLRNHQNQ